MAKRITDFDKHFTQGYICACAVMLKDHGEDTIVRDCLKGVITSIPALRLRGVEEYDIQILKPILNDINERKRNDRISDKT